MFYNAALWKKIFFVLKHIYTVKHIVLYSTLMLCMSPLFNSPESRLYLCYEALLQSKNTPQQLSLVVRGTTIVWKPLKVNFRASAYICPFWITVIERKKVTLRKRTNAINRCEGFLRKWKQPCKFSQKCLLVAWQLVSTNRLSSRKYLVKYSFELFVY